MEKTHYINGKWLHGKGAEFQGINPTTGRTLWSGQTATMDEIDQAVGFARVALDEWAVLSFERRAVFVEAFAKVLSSWEKEFIDAIAVDTGKPIWECRLELAAMTSKLNLSIQAYKERRSPAVKESSGATMATRYKPHGVVAVLGPFNLPGHLPNAHIVPALLAGNAVVFKPSEQTPLVGQVLAAMWEAVDLPDGVFHMIQGGRETGKSLIEHDAIDGVYFTGGYKAGEAIHRAFAGKPEKILALELGGNNPLGIWEVSGLDAAAYYAVQSAFITAGQRCTCARRLILSDGPDGDALLEKLVALSGRILVGPNNTTPEPFMGPVISKEAAEQVLNAQKTLQQHGGQTLLELKKLDDQAMLSPGIIDVTSISKRPDDEYFGPLLQVIRVSDFDALVREANNTAYGLSAGLFTDERILFEQFYREVRAGIINWNRPTTGASGSMPFGGVGKSGNHRPSGYFATDYCSYPVASTEVNVLSLPEAFSPGIEP